MARKQEWKIERFDGGLNLGSSLRDVQDTQLVQAQSVNLDTLGTIKCGGKVVVNAVGTTPTFTTEEGVGNQYFTPLSLKFGSGLFKFGSDYTLTLNGTDPVATESPTKYIGFIDKNANLALYNDTSSEWITMRFDAQSSNSAFDPVTYAVDGVVRISNADYSYVGTTTGKWFGYIRRHFFKGCTDAYTINKWKMLDQDLTPPGGLHVKGTYNSGVRRDFDSSVGDTVDPVTLSNNDILVHLYAKRDQTAADALNKSADAGTGTGEPVSTVTGWEAKWYIAVSYVYEGDQESPLRYRDSGDEFVDFIEEQQPAIDGSASTTIAAEVPYIQDVNVMVAIKSDVIDDDGAHIIDPRIKGINVYAREENAESWWRIATCHIEKGIELESGTGTYDTWKNYERGSSGAIASFADPTVGNANAFTLVTSNGHGLSNGDTIAIENSTNYNGSHTVSSVATNTFEIDHSFTTGGSEGSGSTWIKGTIGRFWSQTSYQKTFPNDITFELSSGFDNTVEEIRARFKTATVLVRYAWIGNVRMLNPDKGEVETLSDVMIKTPAGKFDTYLYDRRSVAAINDGESIVHLEGYNDRILQFKEDTLYIINVTSDMEFLEQTLPGRGVTHSASVTKSQYGITWANKESVFHYDGQNVIDLFLKEGSKAITEEEWERFRSVAKNNAGGASNDQLVGYNPRNSTLLVVDSVGGGTNTGELYIFSFKTNSWTFFPDVQGLFEGEKKSNMIVDWDGKLIFGEEHDHDSESGTVMKFKEWQYEPFGNSTFLVETKDLNFGSNASNKRIYSIYVTHRNSGSNAVKLWYKATNLSSGTGDWVDAGVLTNSASTIVQKFSVGLNNIVSLQLKIDSAGIPNLNFEVDNISIVYREKTLK